MWHHDKLSIKIITLFTYLLSSRVYNVSNTFLNDYLTVTAVYWLTVELTLLVCDGNWKHNLTYHNFSSIKLNWFLVMKLSQVLFRRNRLPNGHLFRGKDRLVQPVLPKDLRKLSRDFEIEERNMFLLRYPYLTEVRSLK